VLVGALVASTAASAAVVGSIGAGHAGGGGASPLAYAIVEEGTSETCSFARLDLGTGDITTIGTMGAEPCVQNLTFAPDGTLYGMLNDSMVAQLVRIDTATGAVTTVGSLGIEILLLEGGGLAFDRAGTLWLYILTLDPDCTDNSCLYRVDPTDATATLVGGGGSGTIVGGLAGLCDGRLVTARGGIPPQPLASVDTATGGLIDLGTLPDVSVNELATEADGTLWTLAVPAVGPGTQILHIDDTGQVVVTGPLLSDARSPLGFAIEPLTCPPPPAPPLVLAPTFTG
jgi:hypothetical protein